MFGRLACRRGRRLVRWVRMGCSLSVEGGLMGLIEWVDRMARWLGQADRVSS